MSPAGGSPSRSARKVNAFKEDVEAAFAARLARARAADARRPTSRHGPSTSRCRAASRSRRGHLHPVTQRATILLDIFRDLGFEVARGPEVELETNNFTKLAFPPDHPATDMQDSFWVTVTARRPTRACCCAHTPATCRSAR